MNSEPDSDELPGPGSRQLPGRELGSHYSFAIENG